MINKELVFATELSLIKDDHIRDATKKVVRELPGYFFTAAASSTGKYHPKYALGSGGLVRHTKAAVKICSDLLSLDFNQNKFSQEERDLIIAALILHDGMKHGLNGSQYTVADHPVVMAEYIRENHSADFSEVQLGVITDVISSHMGQWNTDYKTGEEIMPKPTTELQYFVHMCDYLASRRYLIVEFEDRYEPEKYLARPSEEVAQVIDKIVAICKEKIAGGVDREELYRIIKDVSGEKNPCKITDSSIADEVLAAVANYNK